MGRCRRLAFFVLTWAVLVPTEARAQASIAGVVRDASGAVLPGATVEASSPVLIEKGRSVVTDGTGQYKIVDLRPGTYTVTFTLTGFNAVKREGIELTGSSTVTVNADLAVGSVAETVTVSGETPTVDIQSTQKAVVINEQVTSALPSGRSQYAYAVLVPGVTLTSFNGGNQQDVGGTGNMNITIFTVHGSRPLDQRLMINGLTARNLLSSGWASNFVPDMGTAAEVVMDYSSGSADAYGSGFTMNIIPKEGGNEYRGTFFVTAVNSSFQGNNYTDELKAQGLASPNELKTLYDINPAGGGPILKNRAWFYASMRWQESTFYYAGAYANKNLGDPTKWNYEPDLNVRGEDIKKMTPTGSARITWQATPRNKIGFSIDPQSRYWKTASANQAPEVYSSWSFQHETLTTVSYTSPITNKLLLDARFGHHAEGFVDDCAPTVNPACAGKGPSDQKLADATVVHDNLTDFWYRGNGYCCYAFAIYGTQDAPHIMQAQASIAYVTGAHAMKFGWQNDFGTSNSCQYDNSSALLYQFGGTAHVDAFGRSLVPVSLEQHALPFCATTHLNAEMGIYAQDKWTLGRATINGGLRYDYFKNRFPEQHLGPTVWTPTRDLTIPAQDYYSMQDITPRVGFAYDLTGNGKTALKVAWGKYITGGNAAEGNPITNLSSRATRSWTPSLPFGDPNYYTPQCNLSNPAADGDCGALSDALFGQLTPSAAVDPATHTGWGHRFWSQEFSASVQREILPRVSVDVGYYRRWYGNFLTVDNRAVTAADFTQYSITVPTDPRLPNSGQVLSGLYEVNPAKASLVDNYTTFASNFGSQKEHWNGFDLTVNARPRNGVTIQGGISGGRRSSDTCEIMDQLPETQLVFGIFAVPRSYCHVDEAFLTQGKVLGTYLVPKIDVQIAATFQSAPGPPLAANYLVLPFQAGLPTFSAAGVRLVDLIPIGQPQGFTVSTAPTTASSTEYVHRANQLDLRFSKIFRMGMGGRYRASVNFDLNNALNANYVLAVNNAYAPGPQNGWQSARNILDARLFKFGVQFDF
jgi:hypothetical protein